MKYLIFMLAVVVSFALTVKSAQARLLPQARTATKTTVKASTGAGINVSPQLRSDRRALNISFGNLKNATSLSYTLIYTANGQQEGAGGTISPSGNSATRELLFGTCSKDVCRYHTNITGMKFEVTYTATSGKKYLKRYRIKV